MIRAPRLVAAIASAIIPGAGQLLQRRYGVGAVQLLAAIAFGAVWTRAGGAGVARQVQATQGADMPPVIWWLGALGLLVIALWSVVDAARYTDLPGTR